MKINNDLLNFINKHTQDEFEPYYLYDSQLIKEQCKRFQTIEYNNKSIHFATMANINSDFLRIIKKEN